MSVNIYDKTNDELKAIAGGTLYADAPRLGVPVVLNYKRSRADIVGEIEDIVDELEVKL